MQKIISLFQRNYEGDRLIRDELVPGAEWVQEGQGEATVKYDGTCCMVDDGVLYKRYDAKQGKQPPADFKPAQDADPVTGHWPGWIPVRSDDPASRWHCEAIKPDGPFNCGLLNGTYELVGPKVQGNPYALGAHSLWIHGGEAVNAPRTFAELRKFFEQIEIEGVV